MENKTKIVLCYFFVGIVIFFAHCTRFCSYPQQGTGFAWSADSTKDAVLQIFMEQSWNSFQGEAITVKFVKMNDSLYRMEDVVDCKTFMNIYDGEDSLARGNDLYYNAHPIMNYFKDKNHLYAYVIHPNPPYDNFLIVIGNSDAYKVLGGAYLQIGGKIYCEGKEIEGADVTSFQIIEVMRKDSEWPVVLGKDNKHIYLFDKPITNSQSELFFIDKPLTTKE
ncbi:MAG: DKNYY domain-containing protein [Bacteroidales bacterium]|nr:DKNYY domain-containing protein [Bacteroidales bacterium]